MYLSLPDLTLWFQSDNSQSINRPFLKGHNFLICSYEETDHGYVIASISSCGIELDCSIAMFDMTLDMNTQLHPDFLQATVNHPSPNFKDRLVNPRCLR